MEALLLHVDVSAYSLSLSDVAADDSCEFYFDPSRRPAPLRERASCDAATLDRLGARIDELSARVSPDQRAAFQRDVVEPYRRVRLRFAAR